VATLARCQTNAAAALLIFGALLGAKGRQGMV
jgi:hypothetical protein